MGPVRVASTLGRLRLCSSKIHFQVHCGINISNCVSYKLCLYTADQSGMFRPLKSHTAYFFPPPEHLLREVKVHLSLFPLSSPCVTH